MEHEKEFSDQPSIVRWMPGPGEVDFDYTEKIIIRCGDRTITIRPCTPLSEKGPDGSYPYIELMDLRGEKKEFTLSSKEKFEALFNDLEELT